MGFARFTAYYIRNHTMPYCCPRTSLISFCARYLCVLLSAAEGELDPATGNTKTTLLDSDSTPGTAAEEAAAEDEAAEDEAAEHEAAWDARFVFETVSCGLHAAAPF